MAKKDLFVSLQEYYSTPVSAKGKTAIVLDDIKTTLDIQNLAFKVVDNNLVITQNDGNGHILKGLTLSNYNKISLLKFDYKQNGYNYTYQFVDLIKYNLIDNTSNTISTFKKTTVTGTTDYNDYINASLSDYKPTGKNKKKNTGLTINAKKGSDTIVGTVYNDTITGGTGNNKLIYNTKTFGVDTVKFTKDENLEIQFKNALSLGENDSLGFEVAKNKKDLIVTNSLSDDGSHIVLKNYYAKDTGATVLIGEDKINLVKQAKLAHVTADNYFEAGKTVKKSYTGSALADYIDARALSKATNAKKGTGVTINGGVGYDKIFGSKFTDTIKCGAGNDYVLAGKGADTLYAVSGDNRFEFQKGDGNDVFYSGTGADTLHFYGINLKSSDLVVEKRDLVINYGENDSVRLKNYFDKKMKNVISSAKTIVTKDGTFNLEDFRQGNVVIQPEEETNIVQDNVTSDLTLQKGKNYTINSISDGVKLIFNTDDISDLKITQSGNDIVIVNGEDTVVLKNQTTQAESLTLADSQNATLTLRTGTGDLSGSDGNDVIFANTGDNTMTGGAGKNTYIFKKGDGIDHVVSTSGEDSIRFSDSNLSEINVSASEDNLYIKYSENDRVYLDNFFRTRNDVQVYTADNMTFSVLNNTGFIFGDGVIDGTTGNNVISGWVNNDTVTAGKGDDRIIEYYGKNTYIFNKGDGKDYIYAKGSDSHEDILKFNNSVMSDLKLFKTTSNDLLINYNGGDASATNNVVVVKGYYNTDGTETNKVTQFMLKDDNTEYSIEDDYVNYITTKTDTDNNGFNRYVGTAFNDEFTTNTSGTEVYSGKAGKNTYNFKTGDGVDYVFSESGKDVIKFADVRADGLTIKVDNKNDKTIALYYGENDSNRIVLQNYLDNQVNITIKGKDNTESTVAAYVSQLDQQINSLGAAVAQWQFATLDDSVLDSANVYEPVVNAENIVPVFTN